MSIEALISRVQKVKPTGRDSWMACCPAHDDKNPSLSIKRDGERVLINCFAGCSAFDVLGAVGLDWSDVLPPKPIAHAVKPVRTRVYPSEALEAIKTEARIVYLAACDVEKGVEVDMPRLKVAMERINLALESANV